MIFTELRFITLFALVWAAFAGLPRSWRPWILAAGGMLFYGVYAQAFLAVALALTLLVLVAAHRWAAIGAGAIIVAVLAYFKLLAAGWQPLEPASSATILVPLGLSYLSFELIHLLIERRHNRIPALTIPNLLAFAFFAPARIAGPIKRYPEFVAAVRDASPSAADVYEGLLRILLGLAKKFFVADVLKLVVVSELVYVGSPGQAWKILLAYTFQIYFDFSAYTDIAIGFSRVLGIALPENFRRPYLAPNIREFWDRWHITLSHWVRDYVFMPTGRRLFQTRLRRAPTVIAVISYLVTFLVVGAWHGLMVPFLVWGLYHGLLLAAYHVIRAKTPVRVARHPLYRSRFAHALGVLVTFLCVALGWVPFMTTADRASTMFVLLLGGSR